MKQITLFLATFFYRWFMRMNDQKPFVGQPALRDPDNPCEAFQPGKPIGFAECETDGHYLCWTCKHSAKRKEAQK